MAKKLKKERSEEDMVITSEQLQKFERAARRQEEINRGKNIKSGSGAHATSRRDVEDRTSNTVSEEEIKQIFLETLEEYEGS